MRRAAVLLVALSLAACAGGGAGSSEDDAPAEGAERQACYPNGTCNAGLTCASGRCVRIDGVAGQGGATSSGGQGGATSSGGQGGATSSGGQAGAGGQAGNSSTGGATTAGGAGGGGQSGAGQGGAGAAGSGGQAPCEFPRHLCGGACVDNTPDTGCATSDTCAPCVAPEHADPTCTAGGACGYNCSSGYAPSGGACIATGGGGAAGSTGGAKCSNCVGTCAFPLEDYNCLLDCLINGMDCRWDKTQSPACECF